MDIDYESAMARRKVVHEEIIGKLEARRKSPVPPKPAASGDPGRPVLMAVATSGGGVINQHFGHAREFLVYEATAAGVRFIGHRKTNLYCRGGDSCGEEGSVLDETIAALAGCEVVLCAKIGYEPWSQLEAAGIQPNSEHAMEPIEDAVAAVWREMLAAGALAGPAATRKYA